MFIGNSGNVSYGVGGVKFPRHKCVEVDDEKWRDFLATDSTVRELVRTGVLNEYDTVPDEYKTEQTQLREAKELVITRDAELAAKDRKIAELEAKLLAMEGAPKKGRKRKEAEE